jgi:RNA polymerase sigma-70 factor (ECF subfamily)
MHHTGLGVKAGFHTPTLQPIRRSCRQSGWGLRSDFAVPVIQLQGYRAAGAGSSRICCIAVTRPVWGKRRKTPYNRRDSREESLLSTQQEMAAFLAEVERRAFKHARYAVRDEEAALDIVQDSMLKLAEKYPDKTASELPMLFHRILQNTIHDYFRRTKVRSTWTTLLSALSGKNRDGEDDDRDPLDSMAFDSASNATVDPAVQYQQAQIMQIIETALEKLPGRQREAFLLRYWEEMDVAETAAAMGCSQGSVKTHCSRAVHALAESLRIKGITL